LVERKPEIRAGKSECVEPSLSAAPRYPKRVIAHLMRPAINRLAQGRCHRFADGRTAMKMNTPAWFARKAQQRCSDKSAERYRDIGIAPERFSNFGRPLRRSPCDMQPVLGRGCIEHIGRAALGQYTRRRNDPVRPHEDPMRFRFSPTDPRYADDFPLRLE